MFDSNGRSVSHDIVVAKTAGKCGGRFGAVEIAGHGWSQYSLPGRIEHRIPLLSGNRRRIHRETVRGALESEVIAAGPLSVASPVCASRSGSTDSFVVSPSFIDGMGRSIRSRSAVSVDTETAARGCGVDCTDRRVVRNGQRTRVGTYTNRGCQGRSDHGVGCGSDGTAIGISERAASVEPICPID